MAKLLQELLEFTAFNNPNKTAVSDGKNTITYQELNLISNQLANTLNNLGIVKGDRLGIYLNKSLETVIAIFAILKAGGIYVPLDPSAPVKRIALLLADCQIKILISNEKKFKPLEHILDNYSPLKTVILTDQISSNSDINLVKKIPWSEILKASNIPIFSDLIPEDIAYILYTSGSTGTPKGVMISHTAALNFINWGYDCFQVQESDRLSNHAPFHFDLSIFDLFVAIKAGATVILISPNLSVFPINLARFIEEQKITIWYSVPSILIQLILHGKLTENNFPHLKHILFAGEVFPLKYLQQWQKLLPHVKFYNLYGPTETNVCTYYPVSKINEQKSLPIGQSCANNEVFAINEKGKIAEIDEVGELYVTGPSLMTGYWQKPAITAQVLLTDPRYPNAKLPKVYRTGDLVKLQKDGNYLFLGRKDNVIKSRGYRIDLGEIEQTISNHPDVEEVVVIAIPDQEIGNLLQAIIVISPESKILAKDMEYFCSQTLPKYMIPKLKIVHSLPKTSTGKIDRALMKTMIN